MDEGGSHFIGILIHFVTEAGLPLSLLVLVGVVKVVTDRKIAKKDIVRAFFDLPADVVLLALTLSVVSTVKIHDRVWMLVSMFTIVVMLIQLILTIALAPHGIKRYSAGGSFALLLTTAYVLAIAGFLWAGLLLSKVGA